MQNNSIIIDSGLGGFNFWNFLYKKNNTKVDLFLDTKNMPYGYKKSSELKNILTSIFIYFNKNYKNIILACNTLSVIYEENKEHYQEYTNENNIITMIDMHKKVSSDVFSQINFLATKVTIESSVIKKIYKNKEINFIDGSYLVNKIENQSQIILNKNDFLSAPTILGCTHFENIESHIKKITQKSIVNPFDYFDKKINSHLDTKIFLNNKEIQNKEIFNNFDKKINIEV